VGSGSVHHIAWRVNDEQHQLAVRTQVELAARRPTPVIDRFWFKSVYFLSLEECFSNSPLTVPASQSTRIPLVWGVSGSAPLAGEVPPGNRGRAAAARIQGTRAPGLSCILPQWFEEEEDVPGGKW